MLLLCQAIENNQSTKGVRIRKIEHGKIFYSIKVFIKLEFQFN